MDYYEGENRVVVWKNNIFEYPASLQGLVVKLIIGYIAFSTKSTIHIFVESRPYIYIYISIEHSSCACKFF